MRRSLSLVAVLLACACGFQEANLIAQSIPAEGIAKIILRARGAREAAVVSDDATKSVEISGTPSRPAEKSDIAFVSERHGSLLIIATAGEVDTQGPHGEISLKFLHGLRLKVPAGVEVVRQRRYVGMPDVRRPGTLVPANQSDAQKQGIAEVFHKADALERDGKYPETERELRRAFWRSNDGEVARRLGELFDKDRPQWKRDRHAAAFWVGRARELGVEIEEDPEI